MLPDGLYQITTQIMCAGFVIEEGQVVLSKCAPILRRRILQSNTMLFALAKRIDSLPF